MTSFTFRVHGTPRPKSRPRFVNGRVISAVSPQEKAWRGWVERAARLAVANCQRPAPLYRGAVRVRMIFTFKPPASARDRIGKPHTHKPDGDNLAKLVLDAMERAGVFKNDSQAAQAPPEKWWGMNAGVVVVVEPIEDERAPSEAEFAVPAWLAASLTSWAEQEPAPPAR